MELGPERVPACLRVRDAVGESLDERGLGVEQGEPVLLLDQEQRVHARGERVVDEAADLRALLAEPAQPAPQQLDDLAAGSAPIRDSAATKCGYYGCIGPRVD